MTDDIILTNPEWWHRVTSDGTDLYVEVSMELGRGPGAVRLTYHVGSPDAEPNPLTQNYKSLHIARRRLVEREFVRIGRL